jgi:hypothetical protein
VVARDPLTIHDIRALVDFVLKGHVPHWQAQSAVDGLNLDVLELEPWERVHVGAINRRCNVVSRGSLDVGTCDILDSHPGGVAGASALAIDALRDLNRQGNVVDLEVAENDILDQSTAAASAITVRATVSFSPCHVLVKAASWQLWHLIFSNVTFCT